jgi:hypothetical protein
MKAPSTPFEQVFTVLHFLTNLPDALQKSTQEWMDETQKNLAALSQQIAVPTTAVAIGSWLGLAPAAGFVAVIFRRARVEYQFLVRNLPGYKSYAALVPSGLPSTTTTRAETNL